MNGLSLLFQKLAGLVGRDRQSLGRALESWSVVLFGLVAERGFLILAVILVARQTSAQEYGQYLASFALLNLLVVLPGFGIDAWLLAESSLRPAQAGGLWRGARNTRVMLLLAWAAAAGGLWFLLPHHTYPPGVYFPILASAGGDSLALLAYTALRAAGHNRPASLLQGAFSGLLLVVTLLLRPGAGQIAVFSLARAVVSLAAALAALGLAEEKLPGDEPPPPARSLLRAARPFLAGDLATAIYLRADLTIVALFFGSAASGIYGPALNLTNLTFLLPNALYFVAVPALARLQTRGRLAYLRLAGLQLAAQAVTGLLVCGGVVILAGPLVRLVFGPNYSASVGVVRLLAPVLLLKPLNFGLAALLVTTHLQKPRARVQAVSAAFNLLANLAIVTLSPFGLPAVAVVYGLSEIILLAGYARIVLRSILPAVPG